MGIIASFDSFRLFIIGGLFSFNISLCSLYGLFFSRFLCFCYPVLFSVLIPANLLHVSDSPCSFIHCQWGGTERLMGCSVQSGSRCGPRASLGVILWQTGLFCAGPSSDAVCVLQRIPQSPARGSPGCHRSGGRWRWGEGLRVAQPGCRLSCSLMFFTCDLLPLLKSLCHISHFTSKLPIIVGLTPRLHFLTPHQPAGRQLGPPPFPTSCPVSSKISIIARGSAETRRSITVES